VHDASAYTSAISEGRLPVEQLEEVTREQALEEEMFLGLRQLAGIDLERIEKQYNVNLSQRFDELSMQGLVDRQGAWVKLAPGRLTVSNEVFVALLDHSPSR
jgi:coproporphyrinogen III oxidase-like Fe-S oxidoreductase